MAAIVALSLTACGGSQGGSTTAAAATTAADSATSGTTAAAAETAAEKTLDWPKQAITINTHKAGTNLDYAARALAVFGNDYLGVNLVTNNTSGIVEGIRTTMNAEADGYSISVANNSAQVSDVTGNTDFDTLEDVRLIATIGVNCANWIGIKSDFAAENGIESLQDLIDYTAEHPDELIISDKVGTNTNVVIKKLEAVGLLATEADCGQGADRVTNFLGGVCDIFVGPYSSISQYCANGDVVCLASCSSERSAFSPDIPCTGELGFKDLECQSWYYLCAPKELPDDIAQALEDFCAAAMEDATFKETCNSFEATPTFKNGQETYEFLKEQRQQMIDLGIEG